jgi:hypothetical protein
MEQTFPAVFCLITSLLYQGFTVYNRLSMVTTGLRNTATNGKLSRWIPRADIEDSSRIISSKIRSVRKRQTNSKLVLLSRALGTFSLEQF